MENDFIQSEHVTSTQAPPITDLNGAYGVVQRLRNRLQLAVRGRDEVIELLIIALERVGDDPSLTAKVVRSVLTRKGA